MERTQDRRRGRRLSAVWLTILLLTPVAVGQADEPSDTGLTLPLRTFGGRPVIAIRIDSRGPYDFILDSGAAVTLIDAKLAQELGLAVTGTMETGSPIGPPATFEVTRLSQVEVGPLDLGAHEALLFDLAGFLALMRQKIYAARVSLSTMVSKSRRVERFWERVRVARPLGFCRMPALLKNS